MGLTRTTDKPFDIDEDLNTRIDSTTTAGQTYIWENIRPNAVSTDTDWRLSRITTLTGTLIWANGSSAFNKQASISPTTYTFTE